MSGERRYPRSAAAGSRAVETACGACALMLSAKAGANDTLVGAPFARRASAAARLFAALPQPDATGGGAKLLGGAIALRRTSRAASRMARKREVGGACGGDRDDRDAGERLRRDGPADVQSYARRTARSAAGDAGARRGGPAGCGA